MNNKGNEFIILFIFLIFIYLRIQRAIKDIIQIRRT